MGHGKEASLVSDGIAQSLAPDTLFSVGKVLNIEAVTLTAWPLCNNVEFNDSPSFMPSVELVVCEVVVAKMAVVIEVEEEARLDESFPAATEYDDEDEEEAGIVLAR